MELLPWTLGLTVQVPHEPQPSLGSVAPLRHLCFLHLPHSFSERGASGRTLCPARSASVERRRSEGWQVGGDGSGTPAPGSPAGFGLYPRRFPGTCCDPDVAPSPILLGQRCCRVRELEIRWDSTAWGREAAVFLSFYLSSIHSKTACLGRATTLLSDSSNVCFLWIKLAIIYLQVGAAFLSGHKTTKTGSFTFTLHFNAQAAY